MDNQLGKYQSDLPVLSCTNELMLDEAKDFAIFNSWVDPSQKPIRSLALCLDSVDSEESHHNIEQLTATLFHTSLPKGLGVRIYMLDLTADEYDDDDMNELREFKHDLKVVVLGLYLRKEIEEIMEADKYRDGETWANVHCEYDENGTFNEVGGDPASDDENYGIYVFPTQGGF
ncbi:hypothetical protein FBEOM_3478 [Fusarium beomiforme]|uniref:Uncharacterized protein n=1 Tax=Fusarium beomiforme TaxID=44412 RepID=A0A9P5APL8_9HYPO|nr:hypothetical protein FBEOM_3478 [Fusarium beomiforme]